MSDEIVGLTPEDKQKLITIEFTGGFKDGEILRSDSTNRDAAKHCIMFYLTFSERGKIGKRFKAMSDAGLAELSEIMEDTPEGPHLKRPFIYDMNHVYNIVDRIEDDRMIRVIYKYMGKES